MENLNVLERQEQRGSKKINKSNKYDFIISAKHNGGSRYTDGVAVDVAETVKELTQSKYCNIENDAIYKAFKKSDNNIIDVSDNFICERVAKYIQ